MPCFVDNGRVHVLRPTDMHPYECDGFPRCHFCRAVYLRGAQVRTEGFCRNSKPESFVAHDCPECAGARDEE